MTTDTHAHAQMADDPQMDADGRQQTQMMAMMTARELVKQHAQVMNADDPDTCIIVPTVLSPTKPLIRVGSVRWSLRRALVGASDDERVTATCKNRWCVRLDHLKKTKKRTRKRKTHRRHTR